MRSRVTRGLKRYFTRRRFFKAEHIRSKNILTAEVKVFIFYFYLGSIDLLLKILQWFTMTFPLTY